MSIIEYDDEVGRLKAIAEVKSGSGTITYEVHEYRRIYFQFISNGSTPNLGTPDDLAGKTVDFDRLMTGYLFNGMPLHLVEWGDGFWQEGRFHKDYESGDIPTMGGSITFDESGLGASFNLEFCSAWCNNWLNLRSDPLHLSDVYGADSLTNPEAIEGLTVFDSFRFYAMSGDYALYPGYWRITRAAKDCYELVTGDWWANTQCHTTSPVPIPLPASAWLLLSGLGALSARRYWRRHKTVI